MDKPLKKDNKKVLVILPFKGMTQEFRAKLETGDVNLDWVSVAGFGKDLKTLGKENVVMCCLGDLYRPGVDKATVVKDLKKLGVDVEQLRNIEEIYIGGHGDKDNKTAGYGKDEKDDVEATYFARAIPSLLNTFGMNQVADITVGCCYGNNNKGGSSICKAIEESIQNHKDIKVKGFQGKGTSAGNKTYGISPKKEIDGRSGMLEEKLKNLYGFGEMDQECRTRLKQIKPKSDQEFWLWLKQVATNYINCSQINDFYNKFDQLNYDLGYVSEELVDNQIKSLNATIENETLAQFEKTYSNQHKEFKKSHDELVTAEKNDTVSEYCQKRKEYDTKEKEYEEKKEEYKKKGDVNNLRNYLEELAKYLNDLDDDLTELENTKEMQEYFVKASEYKDKLEKLNESIDQIFDTLFSSKDFRNNFKNGFTSENAKQLFDDVDLALKKVKKLQEGNSLGSPPPKGGGSGGNSSKDNDNDDNASNNGGSSLSRSIGTNTNLQGGSNANADTSNATKQQGQTVVEPEIPKQEGLTEIVANYQTISEVVKKVVSNDDFKSDLPDDLLEAVEEELNKIIDSKARYEVDKKALEVFRRTLGGDDPEIYDFEPDKMRNVVIGAQEVIKKVKELTADHERSLERELEQKRNNDSGDSYTSRAKVLK